MVSEYENSWEAMHTCIFYLSNTMMKDKRDPDYIFIIYLNIIYAVYTVYNYIILYNITPFLQYIVLP